MLPRLGHHVGSDPAQVVEQAEMALAHQRRGACAGVARFDWHRDHARPGPARGRDHPLPLDPEALPPHVVQRVPRARLPALPPLPPAHPPPTRVSGHTASFPAHPPAPPTLPPPPQTTTPT